MTRPQEIQHAMGKLLWSIFPKEGSTIVFNGQFYAEHNQCGPTWFDFEGNRLGPKNFDDYPQAANDELRALAFELQRTPPFDRQPFTHMRLELNEKGQMKLDFAYIPEWDSWPGLFMRGVSELSEEEVSPPYPLGIYGIDIDELRERKARFAKEPYQK